MKFLYGLLSFLFVGSVIAVPESEFSSKINSVILPFYDNTTVSGSMTGLNNVRLSYRMIEKTNSKTAIMFIPGRGEPLRKYAEVVYDVMSDSRDVSWYMLEHRGQGESDRVDNLVYIQYVKQFNDYVEDQFAFFSTYIQPKGYDKVILVGHSMGGATASLLISRIQRKVKSLRVVLVAPMMDINTSPFSYDNARLLANTARSLGLGFMPGTYDSRTVTSSQVRGKFGKEVSTNPKYSCIAYNMISFNWAAAAFDAVDAIAALEPENAMTYLLQAGNDQEVPAKGQDAYCSKRSSCVKMVVENANHEILMEVDSMRDNAINIIKLLMTPFA